MPHVEGGPGPRPRSVAAALLLAGVATGPLPGCRAVDSLEPRRRDSVPVQVGKGLVWVPVMVLCAGVVLGAAVVMGSAQSAACTWEAERDLGRDHGGLGLRRPLWQ